EDPRERRQSWLQFVKIHYATFESHLFKKISSEWTTLVNGKIYVFYFSLKVVDIRYNGLAKSLSKLVLWALLRINSLNDTMSRLETKAEHLSSMKIPDYHKGTPPLKIDLLLKNTCVIPVWLEVQVQKSCGCSPRKNDSISLRRMDFSCSHDDQLVAEFDRKIVPPDETVVLSLVLRYDETEECQFTTSLFVSRNPIKLGDRPTESSVEKRLSEKSLQPRPNKSTDPVVVRIDTHRGIITSGWTASLNFLLVVDRGPRSFSVCLHDIFIGDDSKYVQVICMYNHSQKDIRYWAEWLLVNNKVFKIYNTCARVPAYSLYPLFIEFTPFEIKTYTAKLAVVDELGDEFHISIEASGSICPDLSPKMLTKKMPIISYFTDQGADIELFPSHIVLSPMITHSFDKYIFFMKNNSKEVICFSWESLVLWSTVKVLVQPKEGELQPGEIFPIQMHIHTYRNAAILNILVECIYYNKTKYDEYWKKCRLLEVAARNFDTCFTYLPDKEIEIAYHNPIRKLYAGEAPMNRIVSIGASLRICNRDHMDTTFPTLIQQLKFLPPLKIQLASSSKDKYMVGHQAFHTAEILSVIIRQVVKSKMFQERLTRKRADIRYIDFLDKGRPPEMENLPKRQMGMLLATILHVALLKLFGFDPAVYHDICTPVYGGKLSSDMMFKMYNLYYEQMLSNGIDRMCIPPESMRAKRTISRDNLAFVQRMSI
ncbi:hypothetical protein GE061_018298, partial [Apolygus lucorum]